MTKIADDVIATHRRLARRVERLRFAPPVTHVYDPLVYAREPLERYLRRYGGTRKRVIFLGMNPGPFGMAQCGIPFGSVDLVRDWLRIDGRVGRPPVEHPRRPVTGFDCPRTEVSGQRFWGAMRERCGTTAAFFREHLVLNYCPLVFMLAGGRNHTPDKLPADEREPLFAACDAALRACAERYRPDWLIGVGVFAATRAAEACAGLDLAVGRILHPSPASPAANRGWRAAAERQLVELGVWEGDG